MRKVPEVFPKRLMGALAHEMAGDFLAFEVLKVCNFLSKVPKFVNFCL